MIDCYLRGENLSSNGRKKVEFIVLPHQPKLRLRRKIRHEENLSAGTV